MLTNLLTRCVLVVDAGDYSFRMTKREPVAGGRILFVPVQRTLAPEAAPGEVVVPPADDLDPAELFALALARVTTPWALLLVGGESAHIVAPEALAERLAKPDEAALAAFESGADALVPDPVAPRGARIVPAGSPLGWLLDAPVVAHVAADRAPVIVQHRRARPGKGSEAGWLRALAARRTRERGTTAEPTDVALDAMTLAWAGEHDAAYVRAAAAGAHAGASREVRTLAARIAVAAALASGRLDDARRAVQTWNELDVSSAAAGAWVPLVAALRREPALAEAVTEADAAAEETGSRGDEATFPWWSYAPDPWLATAAAGLRAFALDKAETDIESFIEILEDPTGSGSVAGIAGRRLFALWHEVGRDPAALVELWPVAGRGVLRTILEESDMVQARFWSGAAAAYVDVESLTAPLVVRVGYVAVAIDLEEALQWTARLRRAEITEQSPLRVRATSPHLGALDRLLAAAVAVEAFDDPDALPLVASTAAEVPVDALRDMLLALDEAAPGALPRAVEGAAITSQRALVLADLLDEFGAAAEAAVLRQAASSRPAE